MRARSTFLLGALAAGAPLAIAACQSGETSCADDGSCEETRLPDRMDAEAGGPDGSPVLDASDGATPSGTCVWSKRYGGLDMQFGSAVTVDPSGDILVASSFRGTTGYGAGPLTSAEGSDIAFARLDGTGGHLFSTRFGGVGDQFVTGLSVSGAGNIYMAGIFKGTADFGAAGVLTANADGLFDAYVLRISKSNVPAEVNQIGGLGSQLLYTVTADPSSGATIVGYNQGDTMTINGQNVPKTATISQAFVARMQSALMNWVTDVPGTAAGETSGVVYDRAGNLVVAGAFSGSTTIAGKPYTSAGGYDAIISRFSATGAAKDAFSFGSASDEKAIAIAADRSGGIVAVGEFAGSMQVGTTTLSSAGGKDIFVVHLDSTLAPLFALRFGGAADDRATAISIDANDNIVFGGVSYGDADFGTGVLPSGGGTDAYLAKIDGNGKPIWSRRFGGPEDQTLYGTGLARAPNGDLVLYGAFQGSIDLGCGALTSQDGFDTWLARFTP